MWEDSSEFQRIKKEHDELIKSNPNLLEIRYRQFLTSLSEHWRERFGKVLPNSEAYRFYRLKICVSMIQNYDEMILITHRFFKGKKEEDERVKTFMEKVHKLQLKLNTERENKLRQQYGEAFGGHWGSHTSMSPDFLVRMPRLTFVEVKANGSKLEPRQRLFLKIARAHGFNVKLVRAVLQRKNLVVTDPAL